PRCQLDQLDPTRHTESSVRRGGRRKTRSEPTSTRMLPCRRPVWSRGWPVRARARSAPDRLRKLHLARSATMKASLQEPRSASRQPVQVPKAEAVEDAWKPLWRVGGVAALLSVATIALAVIVFLAWPPPTRVEDRFALFQRNGFLGLLDLDLLLVTAT